MIDIFKKAALKYGYGSVGQTAKQISSTYNLYMCKDSFHRGALENVFKQRQQINLTIPEIGDYLVLHEKFVEFNNWVKTSDLCVKNDLTVLIFQILYFSSEAFRFNFINISRPNQELILDIIYSTTKNHASTGVKIEKSIFVESISKLIVFWNTNEKRLHAKFVDKSIGGSKKTKLLDCNFEALVPEIVWQTDNEAQRGFFKRAIGNCQNLFFGSGDVAVSNKNFYSINLQSGVFEWSYNIGESMLTIPYLYKDHVYVQNKNGLLLKIDLNGRLIWSVQLSNIDSNWKTETKIFFHKPVGFEGTIYLASLNQYIYQIEIESGDIIWKYKTNDFVDCNLVIQNQNLYFADKSGEIYSIRCGENIINWKAKLQEPDENVCFSGNVLFYENNLIFNSFNYVYALNPYTGKLVNKVITKSITQKLIETKHGICFQLGNVTKDESFQLICYDKALDRKKWKLDCFGMFDIIGHIGSCIMIRCNSDGYIYVIEELNGKIIGNFYLDQSSYPYCFDNKMIFSESGVHAHLTCIRLN